MRPWNTSWKQARSWFEKFHRNWLRLLQSNFIYFTVWRAGCSSFIHSFHGLASIQLRRDEACVKWLLFSYECSISFVLCPVVLALGALPVFECASCNRSRSQNIASLCSFIEKKNMNEIQSDTDWLWDGAVCTKQRVCMSGSNWDIVVERSNRK